VAEELLTAPFHHLHEHEYLLATPIRKDLLHPYPFTPLRHKGLERALALKDGLLRAVKDVYGPRVGYTSKPEAFSSPTVRQRNAPSILTRKELLPSGWARSSQDIGQGGHTLRFPLPPSWQAGLSWLTYVRKLISGESRARIDHTGQQLPTSQHRCIRALWEVAMVEIEADGIPWLRLGDGRLCVSSRGSGSGGGGEEGYEAPG